MNRHTRIIETIGLVALLGLGGMAAAVFGQTSDPATLRLRLDAASTATPTPVPDADTPPASGQTTPQSVAGAHTALKTGSLTLKLDAASATPTPVGLTGPEAATSPAGAAAVAAPTVKTGFLTLTLDAGAVSADSDDTGSDKTTTQDEQPGSGEDAGRGTAPSIGRLTLTLDAAQAATDDDPTAGDADNAEQATAAAPEQARLGFLTLNLDANAATEDSQTADDDLKAGDGEADEAATGNLLVLNLDSTQAAAGQTGAEDSLTEMTEEERIGRLLLTLFPQGDVNRDGTVDCYDLDALEFCLLALPSAAQGSTPQQLGCNPSEWACPGDVNNNGCLNSSDVDYLNSIFLRFGIECQ